MASRETAMMDAQFDDSDFSACVLFSVNGRCSYGAMSELSLLSYYHLSYLLLVVFVLCK